MTRSNGSSTKSRKARSSHGVQGGSSQANRLAIAILEVLAGVRSPADAAAALGVSLPRYYQLETRALGGLVAACEPRPQGKQPSLKTRVAALERELEQARRECARQQALVRAAHRSLGLKAAPAANAKPGRDQAGRRRRRPVVRALKAARALQEKDRTEEAQSIQRTAQEPPGAGTAQVQEAAAGGNKK